MSECLISKVLSTVANSCIKVDIDLLYGGGPTVDEEKVTSGMISNEKIQDISILMKNHSIEVQT